MRQRLIALGDSITLGHWDENGGWIAHLRRNADARVVATAREHYATVYNLGISSNTSRHVLGRYRGEVDARHDQGEETELFIVLAVGINDSAVATETKRHLVAPGSYEVNMKALAALAAQDSERRVLLVGPTPVDESKTRPVVYRPEREYRLDFIEEYNEIARRAAMDVGVRFADLFAWMQPHDGHWHEWDGVHLNTAAHNRVAELIEAELSAMGWAMHGLSRTTGSGRL
jgi:lysophospholipase L1-like esterase